MKLYIINSESLDCGKTKVSVLAPISRNEDVCLRLTKDVFDSLGEKAISELRAIEADGYFILKIARILKGLDQSDMAKMLGITLKDYQEKELGYSESDFIFSEIMAICGELKMSADTLFFNSQCLKLA